jgi:hypothetical protein
MRTSTVAANHRRGSRTKAVLPVRVKGKDTCGLPFEDLVHTLDVTTTGVRLGSVRRELSVLEEVTLFFRKRKIQFRVVWTKKLKGTSEFQVGLQAMTQEREAWGMSFSDIQDQATPSAAASQASA